MKKVMMIFIYKFEKIYINILYKITINEHCRKSNKNAFYP
jgi:hypothetical protein